VVSIERAVPIEKVVSIEKAASKEILGQGKCIKQLALNVVRNAKFHSSLQKVSQFIAKNAI